MTGENYKPPKSQANAPGFSASPLIPPVEVRRPENEEDADLNRWANERLAIYASLDAAMTKHIVEAISALNEVKRQVEEDAFRYNQEIIIERDRLKKEVAGLQEEQLQLEELIKDTRRQYQDEQVRLATLQNSSREWVERTDAERQELQLEVRRLKAQLEDARSDLKELYQARAEAIETGTLANWFEHVPSIKEGRFVTDTDLREQTPVAPPVPASPARPRYTDTGTVSSLFRPFEEFEPALPPEVTQIEDPFGDAPTPHVPGGSPIMTVTEVESNTEDQFEAFKKFIGGLEEEEQESKLKATAEISNQPFSSTSASEETEQASEAEVSEGTPELKEIEPVTRGSRERARRARTERRVQQIIGRRRLRVPEISPAADGGDLSIGRDALDAVFNASPVETHPPSTGRGKTGRRHFNLSPQEQIELEAANKKALRELGDKLGLEAMTPPPMASMRFAPGYTPPTPAPSLARILHEVEAGSAALAEPQPVSPADQEKATELPATPVEKVKEEVKPTPEPEAPRTATLPPSPPPFSLYVPDENDLDEDFEFGPLTLEELLAAGEEEIASINENPTPPEEPTPFIGNLLDDAVSFNSRRLTGNITPVTPGSKSNASQTPSVYKNESDEITPKNQAYARRNETGPLLFPGFPLSPPPSKPVSASEMENTVLTRLTVSKLEGSFSSLLIEKQVRDLEGVVQVVVTDFSKGVLAMDVRHVASLDLAAKLLSMSELKLHLVEQDPGFIELSQESTS
ncbi:MAG TPA: hypothetical protein VH186_18425 [Chloroflexia bacterium]|nr:hypothetical protein [Chloroflexia bacterium]